MTVHEKLDYLIKKGTSMKNVGTLDGNGTISTISIEGYENLTANDFIIVPNSFNIFSGSGSNGNGNATIYPQLTYDSKNGIITVSGCYHDKKNGDGTVNFSGKLITTIFCLK